MKNSFGLCAAVVFSALCSQLCWGDAIMTLESQTGGAYDYSLVVTTQAIAIQNGEDIVLSGLSGVSSAAVSSSLAAGCSGLTVSSVASDSVTLANEGGQCFFLGTYGTLELVSSVTTAGLVDFSIQTPGGLITGTTDGPVSSVPEPATWELLLAGFSALCIWRPRHRAL